MLQWLRRSAVADRRRQRNEDLESQRQADRAASESGIDLEESPQLETGIIQEIQVQEHLQELHAGEGEKWRDEDTALLLRRDMPPLYLDSRYRLRFLQDGEAAVHQP